MEADKGQGGEGTADEGCSRVMEEMSDKNGGRKTESPELYFVTGRDVKSTVEESTRL
jgi:hypothetical protein